MANGVPKQKPQKPQKPQGSSEQQLYELAMEEATNRYGLPPGLLRAVARAESDFPNRIQPDVVSSAGAVGLMQILPRAHPGVDPTDPLASIDYAANLLRKHYRDFGSWELALAAYNAGPGRVRQYGGVPPFEETQTYIEKVLGRMEESVPGQDRVERESNGEDQGYFPSLSSMEQGLPPLPRLQDVLQLGRPVEGATPEERQLGEIFDTKTSEFLRGVGAGFVHPVRSFLGQSEHAPSIARTAGEFVGAGAVFFPLAKGAQVVLKGVGLLRAAEAASGARFLYLTPFGASEKGIRAAHVTKWGLAGGAFEAFGGESPEDAPKRFLIGAGAAAGLEMAGAKVAQVWRSRGGKWKPSTPVADSAPVVAPKVAVHSLRLKLERGMGKQIDDPIAVLGAKVNATRQAEPLRTVASDVIWLPPEAAQFAPQAIPPTISRPTGAGGPARKTSLYRYRAPSEAQEGLQVTFMELMANHAPGGQVVLEGLTRKEVKQLATAVEMMGRTAGTPKKLGGYGRFRMYPKRRIEGEDAWDLLVVDERLTGFRATPSLLGQQPIDSPELMRMTLDAIKERYDDLVVDFQAILQGNYAGLWYNPLQQRAIQRSIETTGAPGRALVEVATASRAYEVGLGLSILWHEVTHHWTGMRALRRFPNLPAGERFFFGDRRPKVMHVFTPEELAAAGADTPEGLAGILAELKEATLQLEAREYMMTRNIGLPEALNVARQAIEVGIPGDALYYKHEFEQMARMIELAFIDPAAAMTVAPRATELFLRALHTESPQLRHLLSRAAQETLDMARDLWVLREGPSGFGATVFTRARASAKMTPEKIKAWHEQGWFEGMRALVDGKEVEWVSRMGDKVKVFNLETGRIFETDISRIQRPLLSNSVTRSRELISAIDEIIDNPAQFGVPVNLLETVDLPPGASHTTTPGIRRALVDTTGYLVLKGSVREWVRNLPQAVQEALITRYGTMRPHDLYHLQPLASNLHVALPSPEVKWLKDALELLGYKGMVQYDNGMLHVLVGDPASLMPSMTIESPLWNTVVSGTADDMILSADVESMIKAILRSKGATTADIDYFYRMAQQRIGDRLRRLVDPEVPALEARVVAAQAQVRPPTEAAAPSAAPSGVSASVSSDELPLLVQDESDIIRAGLEVETTASGRVLLRDQSSKSVIADMPDMDHAVAYAKELTPDGSGPNLGSFPGVSGNGGGGLPPKHNQNPIPPDPPLRRPKGFGARLADAQSLFGSAFTALENFAKAAENRGLGAAYTRVYLPTHTAMLAVHRELSVVQRALLGNRTFSDHINDISRAVGGLSRKRYPVLSGYIEALSRQEIEKAGGLMTRAMTPNELRVAQTIANAGLGHDVPRLMAVSRLAKSATSGNLERTISRMKRIKLSPEAQQLLARFDQMPKYKKLDDVYNALGLTDDEKALIKLIEDSIKTDKDKFSIYAVSRWASAPSLKKGFKNAREQFAFENKMTPHELKVAGMMERPLEAAFAESGLDAKRHLSGYWPHLRMWVQEGFNPDAKWLPDDVVDWVATRYRTGELDVYDRDPVATVYRHIRGLYMKQHFDPIMKDVNKTVKAMKAVDGRVGDVMQEYVMELMGRPHASFVKVQAAVSRSLEIITGKKPDDRLVHDVVNGLAAVTSAAVLPFRMALILRNYTESMLKVSPRVGVSYYLKGLQYVTSSETRREAYAAAKAAGAIRPSTQRLRSIFAAEELFGPAAPRAIQRLSLIFDKGFEWYQGADDWGRAIAFHAQRFRILDHVPDLQQGKITIEEFLSRSKIMTYDPLNVQIAERHILAGDYDAAANHLGQVLSGETMTRYGYADHPAGWNSVQGRLLGQFGTWPVQYKDYLIQGMTRGSMKDRFEFAATHAAAMGGLVTAGSAVGLNLANWTGMSVYTGGPFAELGIDVVRSISGSDAEKSLARQNILAQLPILGWMETGNPRSVFLPGSYLLGDLGTLVEELGNEDFFAAVMGGAGFRVLRPNERGPLEWLYDF